MNPKCAIEVDASSCSL